VSEQIKVGDLVMVVKPSLCCKRDVSVGKIYVVDAIGFPLADFCGGCGATMPIHSSFCHLLKGNNNGWIDPWRLKKIDPPTQDESIEQQEKLTA